MKFYLINLILQHSVLIKVYNSSKAIIFLLCYFTLEINLVNIIVLFIKIKDQSYLYNLNYLSLLNTNS